MRKGRRSTAPRAPRKPADAAAGAPHVRKFMVKLFDREDGKAADWPLIAETLLREAFHALDQSPNDPRVLALLRQANAGTYDRLTGNPPESNDPLFSAQIEASNTAGLQSSQPGHDERPR
jgi:hypothetical protein